MLSLNCLCTSPIRSAGLALLSEDSARADLLMWSVDHTFGDDVQRGLGPGADPSSLSGAAPWEAAEGGGGAQPQVCVDSSVTFRSRLLSVLQPSVACGRRWSS